MQWRLSPRLDHRWTAALRPPSDEPVLGTSMGSSLGAATSSTRCRGRQPACRIGSTSYAADQATCLVADTGIEPATSSVSVLPRPVRPMSLSVANVRASTCLVYTDRTDR